MESADTLNTWDGTTEYIYSSVVTGTTTYFDVSASTSCWYYRYHSKWCLHRNWKYRGLD